MTATFLPVDTLLSELLPDPLRSDLPHIFDTADVDGIINQISAAALLTRMLTDHGTGSPVMDCPGGSD